MKSQRLSPAASTALSGLRYRAGNEHWNPGRMNGGHGRVHGLIKENTKIRKKMKLSCQGAPSEEHK